MNILLVSAVALIDIDGRVLIAQRPKGKSMAGLWEFPGGKIEQNETVEQALVREIKEELGLEIKTSRPLISIKHDYVDKKFVCM